jgi:hypothetical protein
MSTLVGTAVSGKKKDVVQKRKKSRKYTKTKREIESCIVLCSDLDTLLLRLEYKLASGSVSRGMLERDSLSSKT